MPKQPKAPKAKKHKGKIVGLVILAIIVLLVVGGSAYYRYMGTKVYVQSVMDMNNAWVLSNETGEGVIQDATTQNIYWDATSDITEVYVEKGDTVAAGDKLFQYDTESLQLQVEQAKLGLDVANYNLEVAKKELEDTGKASIVPTDKAQEDEMKKIDEKYEADVKAAAEKDAAAQTEADAKVKAEHELTYEKIAAGATADGIATYVEGDGTTEATAWTYTCTDDTIISQDTVKALITNNKYVCLKGTTADGTTYSYLLGGSDDVPFTSAYRLVSTMTDYTFPSVTPTVVADPKYPEYDPKGMTESEKKEQTASGEVGIKKAENAVKSAQINLDDAKRRLSEATVTAKINGVILSIGDYKNPPQDGSAFITISSQSGLAVTGYVSELKMDSMKQGDEIAITSWESGSYATATITEVSSYPATNYSGWTNSNSNVSWYPYTAFIEDADGFKTGEQVQISKVMPEDTDAIVLEKIYVRSDDNGNYVLADNGNGRLVKKPVTVERTSESEYVLITDGLTMEDLIAFPYGSKGREGMKTTTQMSVFDMLF